MAYDDDLPYDLDDDMADLADNGDGEDGEDESADAGPAETDPLDIDAPVARWDPGDYAPYVTGVSADKLVSSAVAPLVAAARGYETVTESNLDDAFKRYNLGRKNTRQGRRIIEALFNAELLFMPWFTPEDISHAVRFGTAAQLTSTQLRPSRPQRDENVRERKYEFVSGHDRPIGLHPAIGASWVDDAPVVLAAEGPLKADAALSAYPAVKRCRCEPVCDQVRVRLARRCVRPRDTCGTSPPKGRAPPGTATAARPPGSVARSRPSDCGSLRGV